MMLEIQRQRGDEWEVWRGNKPTIHVESQDDPLYSICGLAQWAPDYTSIPMPLLPAIWVDGVRVYDYRIDGRGSYLEKDADRCRPDDLIEAQLWQMGFVRWERRRIIEVAADSQMDALDLGGYVKGSKPNHFRVRRIIGLI